MMWLTTCVLFLTLAETSQGLPLLLYANRRSICLVDADQTQSNSTTIVTSLEDAAALDFVYDAGAIYWTDVTQEAIKRSWLNGSQIIESIVNHGLVSPDGLACDWIGQKLYWTDSETNRIEVSNLDGSFRKVLFWEDLDQPRAIAVDPIRGYLYWTDWGETPKIERAGMDGSTDFRQVLISTEIFWPNGLTLDYKAEKIYWADGKLSYIHSCNLDGSGRRAIIRESLQHPFAITLFDDRVYWTDWQMRTIYSCDKTTGEDRRAVITNLYSPMDIHVYHPDRQPPGRNPCGTTNGGCSHLCLISPVFPFYRCACPTGVRQLADNKTCADEYDLPYPVVSDNLVVDHDGDDEARLSDSVQWDGEHEGPSEILLLARRTDLRWISLDTADFTDIVMPIEGVRHAIAVDYDPVDGLVYWTDDEARYIRRAYLNATGDEVVIGGSIYNPDGIAVDWIARNLYWTDSGTDRVEVARLNGSSHKVLIADGLDEPRAIVVDPMGGLLFWTDWGSVPKIERSNLDGSDRMVLVNTSLGWPNGLSIDYKTRKIYWADAKTDRIEMANVDGTGRTTLLNEKLPHVFGISLLGEYLYWTDWQDRSIQRVNKSNGRQRSMIVEHLPDLMGLKAVSVRVIEGTNGCSYNNGNCSHLCLNRPDPKGHICACPMGHELLANARTCIVPEAFLLYSRQVDIRRISLETSYNDALIPVPGVRAARALDFDIADNRIYWTDIDLKSINRAFMNGSALERIVEFGLESPEGLAIDWVARNIYWADSGTRRVEMAHLDGSSRKVIVWKDVRPTSVAVNPPQGYVFWSNWLDKPRLERANLDGSGRVAIVTDVGRVSGLTIDFDDQRLFWANIDDKTIESSKLTGEDRRRVVETGLSNPFGLTQYQDFIYWTDSKAWTIEKANKKNGQNRSVVQDRIEFIMDVSVFHSSRQSGWNECNLENGGCSDLCIALSPDARGPGTNDCACPNHLSYDGTNHSCRCAYHCACPTHYQLAADNLTCLPPSVFLLFSQRNITSRILLDASADPLDAVLPIQGMRNIRALDFDPVDNLIYWVDGRTKSIRRSRVNGTDVVTLLSQNPSSSDGPVPYDIAIDPHARALYWSDSHSNVINVTRLDGSTIGIVVRDGQPRSIALAAEEGFLFWTNMGKTQKIERAHLDGTTKTTLFSTGLSSLGPIAVDTPTRKLFWADLDLKRIECSDFDGGNRQNLVDEDIGEPSGLAVYGKYLYWVDRFTGSLERVDKTSGRNRVKVLTRTVPMTDVVVVTLNKSDLRKSPCSVNNGGCSHLCVVVKNSGSRCSCPIGLQLANNERVCEVPPSCKPDQFTCASGMCIPELWRCDGISECDDNSDEVNCSRCPPTQFHCDNGQCVMRKVRCDGKRNCQDESDERNCPPCENGTVECVDDRTCISASKWCDGRPDCADKSDEMACNAPMVDDHPSATPSMPYAIGIGIVGAVVIVVVFLVLIVCLCRQKSRTVTVVEDRDNIVMVAKPSNLSSSIHCESLPRVVSPASCYSQSSLPSIARTINGFGDSESMLYDRNHITGASSSSSSAVTRYPQETLNPPPSPITERSQSVNPYYASGSSKRPSKSHAARLYKRRRKHIPPPPTTPCSTDVCDDSESYSCRNGHCHFGAEYGYESDLLCPPPPTPRSHYLSDDQDASCPPSPSTEQSFFLPYPPPPPASVFSCSDS